MGFNIKITRIKKGIKQKDLAEEVGVSQQYIASLETGRNDNPTKKVMLAIANALETDVQTLFFTEVN